LTTNKTLTSFRLKKAFNDGTNGTAMVLKKYAD